MNKKLLSGWSTIQIDQELIILAIRTLGSYGFEKELVLAFVRDVIVDFLDNDNIEIRQQAVVACANTIRPTEKKICATASSVIRQVFEKLLIVGIADTDPAVRVTVLESFDETFDIYLAMAENLRSLFIALNDEIFDVRKLSIRMIGRLTLRNPACVMPSMRKTLVQLLTELEFSGDNIKEESATLLGHLINSSKQLIKPYSKQILKALLDKLSDSNTRVASAVLQTTGELSMVAGSEVEKHLPQLLPIVIASLQDKSSTRKRHIALRALGHFIESTGYAIKPLHQYPKLMDILLTMIKTERIDSIREELFRVLGILGALDPFQYKLIHQRATRLISDGSSESSLDILNSLSPSTEEYCSTAAIIALMKILGDSSLSVWHGTVIECMLSILADQEETQIPLLVPLIMPPFLQRLRSSSDQNVREALLVKSRDVVSIMGEHLVDFLGEIFELIIEFWNSGSGSYIMPLLSLIEVLGDIFTVHLSDLIPQILSMLQKDFSESGDWEPISKVLHTLEVIAHNLDDYLHLIIPALVRLMEQIYVPIEIRKATILTIGRLSFELNFEDYASRIGHPLARILETEPLLRDEVMDTLCILIYQLWTNYAIVIQVVNKVMIKQKISHKTYDNLVSSLLKKLPRPNLSSEFEERMKPRKSTRKSSSASKTSSRDQDFQINEHGLQKAWKTSNRATKEDWNEWMRKFSVELLRNSSSFALRRCFDFAQRYNPLAMQLFNPAFLSVWTALGERMRDQLVQVIINALSSPDSPPEIMQILLNCLEWMERDGKPITAIDIKKLGEFGTQCHAYAKALHYKEIEFREKPDSKTIEELISLNTQLQQPEAAVGILTFAQKQHDVKFYPSWYIKLQRWEDALGVYSSSSDSDDAIKHQIICYHQLGEWNKLISLLDSVDEEKEHLRSEIAPLGASAAWHLGNWKKMETIVKAIDESFESYFYQSIIAFHNDHYSKSQKFIKLARRQMDNELTALVGESYHRAYDELVRVQQLSELEEIIQYKLSKDDPDRRKMIIQLWKNRINGCQRNVEVWEKILQVRSLVLSPKDEPEMWLEFTNLCRQSGSLKTAHNILITLLGKDYFSKSSKRLPSSSSPIIIESYLKQLWSEGDKKHAFEGLQNLCKLLDSNLLNKPNSSTSNTTSSSTSTTPNTSSSSSSSSNNNNNNNNLNNNNNNNNSCNSTTSTTSSNVNNNLSSSSSSTTTISNCNNYFFDEQLLARCHLKLGQWRKAQSDKLDENEIPLILESFKSARELSPNWYKAWNEWAYINFEVLSLYNDKKNQQQQQNSSNTNNKYASQIREHLIASIHGFFQCIALSPEQSLQDTLRVLTLWFKYGDIPQAITTLKEGFELVSIDTWLQVIPQIIARIHSSASHIRKIIQELLSKVARCHPQALVFPLIVASKSTSSHNNSNDGAQIILNQMKKHSRQLVEQTSMVSYELIRVSIVWHEMWHEALEEASRCYFNENNPEGMLERIFSMYKEVERGPETLREIAFEQNFGRDLNLAYEWCKRFQKTKNLPDINQAWDIFSTIFRRIAKMMTQMKTFDLEYVSPYLLNAHDLDLAVPGTYKANQPIIKIKCFNRKLKVFSSKQRPRQMSMDGSDGKNYTFLLKGHEDLRQDERVMQLFGLVNTLLENDTETSKSHLSITRFSVIPLSPNSGVIGWVPSCDTLLKLIQDYRESKGIELRTEHKRVFQMISPDNNQFDNLTLIQKVEIFEHSLAATTGDDINHVLWLKSKNAESWLERRLTYTRSLALMSMVGYILGLGDRHPSNLMLERNNGKIVHIDFGDCFEVAMTRDKYPEKIPFRLTRMLIKAMEASQIEGNFRTTCENVMRVMRTNKESLMAVLEAFVHDPLLNWRLLGTQAPSDQEVEDQESSDVITNSTAVDLRPALSRKQLSAYVFFKFSSFYNLLIFVLFCFCSAKMGSSFDITQNDVEVPEVLNEKAVEVITRVQQKLTGTDFTDKKLTVDEQVAKLIDQATSTENLSQGYFGWCPFW